MRPFAGASVPMSLAPAPAFEPSSVTDRLAAVLDWADRNERALWAVAVLALAADVALTRYGLANGLVERNPVARAATRELGFLALVGMKAGALAVGVGGRAALPSRYAPAVPLALALPWGLAAGVNAVLVVLFA